MTPGEGQIQRGTKTGPGRIFVPALVLARLTTMPLTLTVSILLVDIAATFEQPLGVTGQLQTVYQLTGAVMALLLGALSVRYRHKSLLMGGLGCLGIAAVGCYLAPTLLVMLIVYSLAGIGLVMVEPMAFTLIGEHQPLEKRSAGISWIFTGAALGGILVAPMIGYIGGMWGWRGPFLVVMMPLVAFSLGVVSKGVPEGARKTITEKRQPTVIDGFKEVSTNRSAIGCLGGWVLLFASWQMIYFFSASVFRERFELSRGVASLVIVGVATCAAVGAQMSGRLVNQVGRQRLTVGAAFCAAVLSISFTQVGNVGVALGLNLAGGLCYGMVLTAGSSLTLEQIPEYRGTMMSIQRAAGSMGAALGVSVGGLILLQWGYSEVGLSLGVMGLVAALIYNRLVRDPTKS